MANSSQEMRDADDLSRKELQAALKGWGLPSSGTNAALRQRYSSELDNRHSISQLQQQHGKSLTPTKLWSMPTCLPVGTAASTSPYPQPVSNTKKKPPPDEKRLKRYRSSAPAAVQQRISRAKTQRMYLIKRGDIQHGREGAVCCSCEFVVLGSTGNVYTVTIQKVPNCTCPDHARAAWIESELRDMFAQFEARLRHLSGASASVLANATVREAFAKMEQGQDPKDIVKDTKFARKAVEEDDCPICFDAMSSSEATTFCRARCGANFHQDCIKGWLKQRHNPTCPMCREPWEDQGTGKRFQSNEGFANLGTLQGQSPVRDTSSYATWHNSPDKRRRWY